MVNLFTLKRGASLDLTVAFEDDDGQPLDLTGATLTAQIRDAADALVATLAPAITVGADAATIAVADTSAWPLGMLRLDVRVVLAGQTSFSDTISLNITRAVTQ